MLKINNGLIMGLFVFFLMIGVAFQVQAQEMPDPCPLPDQLAKQTPPDMAAVQADIDILSLCVERANLLKEMNRLVEDMAGGALGLGGVNTAVEDLEDLDFGSVEPVAPELFDLPEAPPSVVEIEPVETPAVERRQTWEISNIYGAQEKGVKAKLVGPKGQTIHVSVGDVLEDGSVVEDVSIQGVVLNVEGRSKSLEWE